MSTIGGKAFAGYCPLGKVDSDAGKMPASCVSRVSAATDGTPSLVVIAVRCSFTVRSWMPRSLAVMFQ